MRYSLNTLIVIPFPGNFTKIILGVCCVLALAEAAAAQLSDLRYSRQPLPGGSDISEVGLAVDFGSAQDFIQPNVIIETLQHRLETLGYRVAQGSTHSPDGLLVQVDCQALHEKISSPSSGALKTPSANVQRLSPPCRLAYRYQQEVIPWKKVDRFVYSESAATMKQLAALPRALKPQECAKQFFQFYDFPVLLAAEWGHVDRLLQVIHRPSTPVSRQRLILTVLGETHMEKGYPILIEKLQDFRVAKEAAQALGFFGLPAQKHLLPILQDYSNPLLQEAAAKGLGRIAATTGNSQHTPLYMKMVADSTVNIRVRTQLAWALGKAPDMRAFSTLLELEQQIWAQYSHDPQLQEFREAVDWSIREVKQGGHGDDF